jgi:hypothetical protein
LYYQEPTVIDEHAARVIGPQFGAYLKAATFNVGYRVFWAGKSSPFYRTLTDG